MYQAKSPHKQYVRREGQEATSTDRRKWRERPRRESGHCRKTPQRRDTSGRILKKSASVEKVKVQAKDEARMKNVRSSLSLDLDLSLSRTAILREGSPVMSDQLAIEGQ
jgi:hypothetical protein